MTSAGTRRADVVVIGGGIVGLATARAIQQMRPNSHLVVLEKEMSVSGHQTGRNSGVLHSGVYYKPGSDKAVLCTAGRTAMVEYCQQHDIAYEICGKVVVAVESGELEKLQELERRCVGNGVQFERIDATRIRELEPHCAGIAGLHVKTTGIADYPSVARRFASDITEAGGQVLLSAKAIGATDTSSSTILHTTQGDVEAGHVVNCAGLHADRIARMIGGPEAANGIQIIPFRGEYFELIPAKTSLVKALIYPVPDPRFPFLGVHLTRGVSGRIHAGPNAVLAMQREGYNWMQWSATDLAETVRSPGFRSLAARYWKYGAAEMYRSFSKRSFAKALSRLVPGIEPSDLEPASAGVRAQAISRDGTLLDDFAFGRSNNGRALHVLNAPSPAATASLAIGERIAREILAH